MNGYKKRTLKKKTDILVATKTLVSNIPFDSITIQSIAKSASVSQVTIYNIFGNKENLIKEAILEIIIDDVHDLQNIIDTTLPFSVRLGEYFRTLFENMIKKPQLSGIVAYVAAEKDENFKKLVSSQYVKIYPYLEKMYEEGHHEGSIRSTISLKQFIKLLNLFTLFNRDSLLDDNDREELIESIIKSFR